MKVQISEQSLRIRLDEAEFARLREGETLSNQTALGATATWSLHLVACAASDWSCMSAGQGGSTLSVPRSRLQEYTARLPCRDGIEATLGDGATAIAIALEVDVRDSVRQRGVGPRRPRVSKPAPSA